MHRCAVLTAESQAAQSKHRDIQEACAHLHGMIEAVHGALSADRRPFDEAEPSLRSTIARVPLLLQDSRADVT